MNVSLGSVKSHMFSFSAYLHAPCLLGSSHGIAIESQTSPSLDAASQDIETTTFDNVDAKPRQRLLSMNLAISANHQRHQAPQPGPPKIRNPSQ